MGLYFSEYFKQTDDGVVIVPPGDPDAQLSAVKIANDFLDEEYLRQAVELATAPEIGEIKFLSVPDLEPFAAYESCFEVRGGVRTLKASRAADFDGWVFPDGALYSVADTGGTWVFSDAYYGFKALSQNGVFNVPTLSNFVKLNPGLAQYSPYARHEHSNPVPRHMHEYGGGSSAADVVAESAFYIYMTEGYGSTGEYIHKNNDRLAVRVHTKMDYDIQFASGQLSNYAPGFHAGDFSPGARLVGADLVVQRSTRPAGAVEPYPSRDMGESYPAYDRLPVMVYIGKAV